MLLSDYAKGVLTARVIRNVIDAARKLGKPVIVDPKNVNFAIYRGATLLTPNRKEFAEATLSRANSDQGIADAAQDAMQIADCEAILVTQSEQGMTLVLRSGEAIHVPAHPVKVRDVSGAGDTVAAALAVARATGADWETCLRVANAAAAVAVSKKGTATVTSAELRRRILPHASLAAEEKIVEVGDLDAYLSEWKQQGLRVGFTNGCFDILHPGHVKVLTAARGACDRLVVGLNSDHSVRRLKGEGRPVQHQRARAEVLAALEAVDLVVIFEEDTPIRLITLVKPSVLVKGGDYSRGQVVGHEIVESEGGRVLLVDVLARLQYDLAGRSCTTRKAVNAISGKSKLVLLIMRWRNPASWATAVDVFAILVALSLPWSTSLPAIFATAMLISMVPLFDVSAFLHSLKRPICVAPIALFALAVLGTLWSDAAWGVRLHGVGPTVKLLVLPVLLYHFERSERGLWVLAAFLLSCTLLTSISWIVAFEPGFTLKAKAVASRGIFVKNYIDQSQEFAICAVALAYPIITLLRAGSIRLAVLFCAIASTFVLTMLFVIVSRTALVTMPSHVGLVRSGAFEMADQPNDLVFDDPRCLGRLGGIAAAGRTVSTFIREYQLYKEQGIPTSIGERLEFWQKSLRFFGQGPSCRSRNRIDAGTFRAGSHRSRRARRQRSNQ